MQISELRRKYDEANSLAGALEREVASLRAREPERIEAPVAAECPTCAPIIRAVAQAIATAMPSAPTKPSDVLPPCRPRTHNQYTAVSGTAVGIGERIRTVLRTASAPMSTGEIAEAGGVPAKKVATNIPHLCFKGDVIRVGEPVYKIGYRYWLKARPLPQGVSA